MEVTNETISLPVPQPPPKEYGDEDRDEDFEYSDEENDPEVNFEEKIERHRNLLQKLEHLHADGSAEQIQAELSEIIYGSPDDLRGLLKERPEVMDLLEQIKSRFERLK